MSGTSLDGIDTAIVDFSAFPPETLFCKTWPYDDALKQRIRGLCQSDAASLDTLYSLDAELGERYAEAINKAIEIAKLDASAITAIGCHGQTICHSPNSRFAYTTQIGDPNRLAALTGITTVADFRRKDIAFGGQGAPLASAFHQFLFRSPEENRALINIGGIANISYLAASSESPVIGFDTGPGNSLLDHWIQRHKHASYDEQGAWGASGKIIQPMLERMLGEEDYFALQPPKTTGTDYFSPTWLNNFLPDEYDATDVQATLVELTAITIAEAISSLEPGPPSSCYICGGGAHNHYLLERLDRALPDCNIKTTAALGMNPDYVEAIAFAWLARERLHLRSGNLVEVTEASKPAILGGIYAAD
jgi:anhydro-N-acetylmuramic acid kinase